jgi:hypothetical protein
MIVNNPDRLTQIRERLSDVSWWMRCTAENIARRANKEENISGRFWNRPSSSTPVLRWPMLAQQVETAVCC